MKNLISVLLISMGAGCVVASEPVAVQAPEAAQPTAPVVANFPRSGGASMAQAEAITIGSSVEGVATMGSEVFYKFDAQENTKTTFTFYAEGIWEKRFGFITKFNILDENGGKLRGRSLATYATVATSDFNKTQVKFKARATGTYYLQVNCIACKADAHYKIVSQ